MTVLPTLRHRIAPIPTPAAREWSTIAATDAGPVTIRGLYVPRESSTLVIVIHGLGGNPESGYLAPIVNAAEDYGWSTLRIALRGSEGIGGDFYHAGLTEDVKIALAAPEFEAYERVFVVGFSLGGHIALRLTTEEVDPRVAGVAAVCPPIDLRAGVAAIDSPSRFVYRQYVLRELREMYRRLARTTDVPTPIDRVRRVRTLREWDAVTVVPRFGFTDVDDYYDTAGIAGRIDQIALPALMVHSPHDPMIPPSTVEPVLRRASDLFEARWVEGAGHVFFPGDVDLGLDAPTGLGPQVIKWLES
jgi:predicted alpha/beta-fold hydrolase